MLFQELFNSLILDLLLLVFLIKQFEKLSIYKTCIYSIIQSITQFLIGFK